MEKELIVIAKREDAKKNLYGGISTLALFTVFLALDIIFFIRDREVWQLIMLIIAALLVGAEIFGLLVLWSNLSFAKRIRGTALISFDGENNVFVVTDCVFKKQLEINKDDVIEIRISDKGETYLWYNKEAKKTSAFIGYSNKNSEDLINNELQKYKYLYC